MTHRTCRSGRAESVAEIGLPGVETTVSKRHHVSSEKIEEVSENYSGGARNRADSMGIETKETDF